MLKNTITIDRNDLEEFERYLYERENARATIRKYMTDIRTFCRYLGQDNEVDKRRMLLYKEWLLAHYAISSANSMLAALNQFLKFKGYDFLTVKRIKTQRNLFRQEERADKRGIPASGRGCQASGERTAGPLYGNDCRYRNPYQRASIFHRRTGKKGTDRNHQQRKVQKDFSAGSSEKEAAGLFQKEGNPGRLYFRYTKWEAERPE